MKQLNFSCQGETWKVNENGDLFRNGLTPSGNWKFLGVSFHHWRRGIDVSLQDAFKDPKRIIGGLVWDVDHGTTRTWGGSWGGKLPRITNAWISEV